MVIEKWIIYPICKNKTHTKIHEDTVLKNFPLFCPKCRQETIINVEQMNITVIKEPATEPITNENDEPLPVKQTDEKTKTF